MGAHRIIPGYPAGKPAQHIDCFSSVGGCDSGLLMTCYRVSPVHTVNRGFINDTAAVSGQDKEGQEYRAGYRWIFPKTTAGTLRYQSAPAVAFVSPDHQECFQHASYDQAIIYSAIQLRSCSRIPIQLIQD